MATTDTNYAIIAADATGSIDLFGHLPAGDPYIPSVGDKIAAAGTYSPFDSIPEIATLTSLASVSSGNAVPAAILVTTTQLAGITKQQLQLPRSFSFAPRRRVFGGLGQLSHSRQRNLYRNRPIG